MRYLIVRRHIIPSPIALDFTNNVEAACFEISVSVNEHLAFVVKMDHSTLRTTGFQDYMASILANISGQLYTRHGIQLTSIHRIICLSRKMFRKHFKGCF